MFYHFLRSVTPKNHLQLIKRHLDIRPTDTVLEVGCGRGETLGQLGLDQNVVTGVDADVRNVDRAVYPSVEQMDAQNLKFADSTFNKIYSFHLIEHLADPLRGLKEMTRVLKAGGRLLITCPAEPIRGLFALPASLSLYGNPLKARQIHRHRLNRDDLLELGRLSGLANQFIQTTLWPPEHLALFVRVKRSDLL